MGTSATNWWSRNSRIWKPSVTALEKALMTQGNGRMLARSNGGAPSRHYSLSELGVMFEIPHALSDFRIAK
jgi:hypothetical protein